MSTLSNVVYQSYEITFLCRKCRFANIITVSFLVLHDKGYACCQKCGRYWILCWFCGALTSIFWGIVADRYGRKPVIVIGLLTLAIFNVLFGLSTSFWMAITARFLFGCFHSLLGPIRACAVEVARPEYHAIGLSLVSTAWGMGLVLGSSLGGFLAQPAEKFPHIFSGESFFGRFPYFLPCLCISLLATAILPTFYWLPESLHMHHESKSETLTTESVEASLHGSEMKIIEEGFERSDARQQNIFTNWPLMSSIIVYCVFSLYDMAYTEVFPLWAESGRKYGGLGFSSQDVGMVLSISGSSLLLFQLVVYRPMEKLVGHINLCRAAAVLAIPLTASFPFMTELSGIKLTVIVNCASMLKNVLSTAISTGLFILQNNAVTQYQRGAANGISMTGQSIFKGIAPATAGVIFSWAQKRQNSSFLPGNHMVFFLLNLVDLVGLLMTFKPFLAY
ncbi:hypothetical protein HPP92_018384 [Vanilla planifolia]|uniref:Major facilitator superfamily (MFS) profile domain-containing protein n=1 Tax=Vanilla planifolia TaxID=51239 RepID=A0A835Q6Y1_VANPL|nr:hypothetical protein HPP92_018384 [Vanilla planifolia]